MNTPISEDDLHAHADGQLAPERQTQVEAWLAVHPEQRAQVDAWREQAAALHRQFDAVLDEPVPARLLPPPAADHWFDARKAAAVAWLMLGGVTGFFLRGETVQELQQPLAAMSSLPRQAAIAHAVFVPEVRHPVEVGADQEAHLVAWLSKRLGSELKPPQLEAAGYKLMGGRLLPGDSKKGVAQFMYENAARDRLTLYVQPDAPTADGTGFRYAREDGIDVFYWVDGRFGYALSGSTGRDDMLRLATLVYRQHDK
ncbi:MAG: anti-sigma factor [Rhodocyclaceae bacterium]|nr:anti-sigma factor [Rhodocyclaceae bacterium]